MKTTLLKGGTVILGDAVSIQDIFINGETIAAVGDLSGHRAVTEIDATGWLVFPGAIDTHVHFNDEFMNTVSVHDYYTGTLAAAYGGVTSVVDFSNQDPTDTLMDTLRRKKEEAAGKAIIDWGTHPVITKPTPETLRDIPAIVEAGAPTVKCYMTYREEGLLIEGQDLVRISAALRDAGGMLMLHAEDNDALERDIERMIQTGSTSAIYHARSRPKETENTAISRAIDLSRATGGRVFIVHMTTSEGVRMVAAARAAGVDIVAETCTHYLMFTDDVLKQEDGIKWICSPPLRSMEDQNKLWEGLQDGRLAMVTSDDAAFSWEAKLFGKDRFDKCPNGIPGIEPRLNLLYSEGVVKGRISLPRLVEVVATTPAKLFGLWPKKGSLLPGSDADIVLFDPNVRWTMDNKTLHMATDWSAYENIEVTGKIQKVFSRGELIVDGETCLAKKGRGNYLHRTLDLSIRPSI